MKLPFKWIPIFCPIFFLFACDNNNTTGEQAATDTTTYKGTYAFDKAFLQQHESNLIELSSDDGTVKVLLSPQWQGRVMTSTSGGNTGLSYGWLNYDLLSAKGKKGQFNAVGGEERFWLGPEGGQYSIYFKKGDSFNIARWQVPAIIDTIGYEVSWANKSAATFTAKAKLTNYSGTNFDITINREISLLAKSELAKRLGIGITDSVNAVAYETNNSVTNTGSNNWTKQSGLLSIWLLGMFTPTPETFVIIPFQPVPNARSLITDNYFGAMPAERLKVKDSVLFFTCDGKHRSKIGLSPLIAKSLAASYDFANNVLTVVLPEVHPDKAYVNSKWEIQQQPYKGDMINAYNDGPLEDGSQLGPFYEIESSSPALELKKGATGSYHQVTGHLQGSYPVMKQFVQQLLAVNLDELKRK